MKYLRNVRNLIFIGLCLTTVVFLGMFLYGQQAFAGQLQEKQRALAKAQASQESVGEIVAIDETQAVQSLHSAKSAGDAVADLQNEFLELMYKERLTEEEEKKDYARIADIQDSLSTYFESRKLSSVWYSGNLMDAEGVAWRFCTNYECVGVTIPSLWVLGSDSGVFAYVTADYDAVSGRFDKGVAHVTVIGNSHYDYTGTDEADDVEGSGSGDSGNDADDVLDLTDKVDRNLTDEQRQLEKDYVKESAESGFFEERQKIVDQLREESGY